MSRGEKETNMGRDIFGYEVRAAPVRISPVRAPTSTGWNVAEADVEKATPSKKIVLNIYNQFTFGT